MRVLITGGHAQADAIRRAPLPGQLRQAHAIARARVYVDTPTAMKEGGDVAQPLASGLLTEQQIAGDLAELAQGRVPGRSFHNQITLFKSTGTALEDLAAAVFLFENARGARPSGLR